jgi:uncharacterized protein with FMN-binding domain
MTSPRSRPAAGALATGFASLGLLTLAGCAVDSATADPSIDTPGTTSANSTSGPYTDGTYTAEASYQAPSGTETVTVELTIADDTVTAVTVSQDSSDREARGFQERFASGISAQAVGKDVASLSVSRVSGSSLTSAGFNAAVEQIRSQAG